MRTHGVILSAWLLGTIATFAQGPAAQPMQPARPTYPPQIQPVQATGQPGTGAQPIGAQPGQPLTGQPLGGQPKGTPPTIPQPVLGKEGPQLPPLQPLNPNDPLDSVLMAWEGEMMKVQTLAAQLDRVETDLAFKTKKESTGFAQYMKTGGPKSVNLAMLDMREKEKKTVLVEKFICTGTDLYQFSPAQQVIRAMKMPEPPPGQVANDNFLSFLFGMRAQEAKRRYDLKLGKQDQHYYYIDVLPRLAEDKADFTKAQVVLNKGSFLPRMLWFENNGSTTTWDIPAIKSGVEINRAAFDAPKPPDGWKMEVVPPQTGTPKLIRGQ